LQRGDLARAVVLREGDRALLRNVPVGRDGDDQNVAQRFGLFEVDQMADVNEVERPVALDDFLAAVPFPQPRQFVERHDLVPLAHTVCDLWHHGIDVPSVSPAFTASRWNIFTVSSEKSARSLPIRSNLFRMSAVSVMMWHPEASA